MKQIDHIGIAVKNIDQAIDSYTSLLGTPFYKKEIVKNQEVITAFFRLKEQKIELLAATSSDSPIAKFIERKGEGIHHLAFEVENIVKEVARLIQEGFQPLQDKPYQGADNKMVAFFHPKDAHGVLIEICEQIPHES